MSDTSNPTAATSPDTLSPEDIQDLVHAQQHLYSSGDPRAGKLYDYIVSQGYATKDAQGGLVPRGTQPVAPGWGVGSVLSGTDPAHQAFDRAAETVPVDTSSVGGFAKTVGQDLGAGATRMFAPFVHPVNSAVALAQMGRAAAGDAGAQYEVGQGMVAPFVKNPSGEAVAAIPAAVGATFLPGEESAASNAIERAMPEGGIAGASMAESKTALSKLVPSFVDGPPADLMTRAVKPGKNNIGWNQAIQTALPLMKSAEKVGSPVTSIDDAIEATAAAKKQIWQQYEAHTGQAGQMGATIDGNQIADAMMDTIGPRARQQNPALVDRITQQADAYRRPMSTDEAEEFLSGKQGVNADLNSYYAKNKVGRRAAEADPEMASTVAEGDALRDALYTKLDQVSGPGAAQLKQQYGALLNVENELRGRQLVAARQQPESLSEQIGLVKGGGKIAAGMVTLPFRPAGAIGDIAEGVQNIGIARMLKARNSADAMIERAFKAAEPAPPFSMPKSGGPTWQNPNPAGPRMLERGAIQTPPPPQVASPLSPAPPMAATTRAQRLGLLLPQQAGGRVPLPYSPGMSSGEQVVALQHLMRNQRAPLALPARAQPFITPPPS